MMSRIRNTLKILAVFLLANLLGFGSIASAAEGPSVQTGIAVSPAFIQAELSARAKTYVAQITVTNNYDTPIALQASLQAIDEVQGRLIPTQSLDAATASAIKLPESTFEVKEHSSYIVSLTFTNTDALSVGGHYAALVLTQAADKEASLSVKSSVVVGIFLVKRGGEVQNLETQAGAVKRSIFTLPKTIQLSFKNTGNVHVTPRAAVLIYKGDELLAKGVSNEESRVLLPDKKYDEEVSIHKIADSWYPAFLTLRIQSRVDGSSKVNEYSQRFLYVPPMFAEGLIIGLMILVLVVRQRNKIKKMLFNKQYFKIKKKITLDPTIVEKEELPIVQVSKNAENEKNSAKKTKQGRKNASEKMSTKKQ